MPLPVRADPEDVRRARPDVPELKVAERGCGGNGTGQVTPGQGKSGYVRLGYDRLG